ncbi:hypothetical protein HNR46_002014 [Haloferula luteola]|uniref:Uncharacterized protein n=1 Tax=Haloferula luteola TaxID=595692 RepID=A0A840V1B0_9BACT|nr:hypothetical protein [Haloferula luteola]MBB5351775.1 hypothetical protein [Haloferula luteola]
MKMFVWFLLGCVPSVRAVDFIRQIQLIDGRTVVYDIPVSGTTGSILSKPLEGDGALFQLYAYQDESYDPFSLLDANVGTIANVNVSLDSHLVDVDLLGIHLDVLLGGSGDETETPERLDEVVVGTYLPSATVVLHSRDPYPVPRTRADQPFGMTLQLRHLALPDDPKGGIHQAELVRDFRLYHPELHAPYPDGSGQGSYADVFDFTANGDFSDSSIYQALPVARPSKASGEETFAARVALGSEGEMAVIGSATMQVWPVCEGRIEGVEEGVVYKTLPSEVRYVCDDLYPDSVTYAQIYAGSAALGASGKVVASSVVTFNTSSPQDAVMPIELEDLEADVLEQDGVYTIELLTVTPFFDREPERVAAVSFELDRTVEVRATLATTSH